MWSVFFVFLSYLDRNFVKGDFLNRALDAEKESKEMFSMLNGTLCAKMSTVRENFLYQVSDGAEAVRSFVSPAGKLVNCSIIVNPVQVKSFMHECWMGLKEQRAVQRMETRFTHMEEAKMMCKEFKEKSEGSGRLGKDESDDSALQDQVLKRSKRGFTYPGTLWCGAGNMADNYDQLGEFAETDSCCRIHDHCPHVIHAFSSKYGYTNFKWHSVCHCDCDNALKDCLRGVNDTSSRVVGQAFFNVIGVPCFEFAYEEQCAERHWYGMCKRYQKFPIAVVKEAVPYDFGGIDVIDVLTLAPPMTEESDNRPEEKKPESTTQSSMSGPEEPSLTNVVTAAEDFIKVLATVSTSQSSTTDPDKAETQSSEKKKRKNTGKKKKTKKQKGKGKGRKRKQKAEAGVKVEEGAVVSTSGNKAEDAISLSNFIRESHKHNPSSRNTNGVKDREYELGERDEPSNEVMKDEPAMGEPVPITTTTTVEEKPARLDSEALTESTEQIPSPTSTTTVVPQKAKTKRLRKGRRKKGKEILPPEKLVTNTTDDSKTTSVPATITIVPTARPEKQSTASDTEKRPVFSIARTPIVIPKVKRNRSKERGDREGRKKRRKVSSASPIVAIAHENSSMDNLKVIPLTGTPIMPLLPTTEQQVSHKLDFHAGQMSVQVTALNSSYSVLKRQKLKGRGLRSRRRKTVLPQQSDNPLFHNSYDNVLPVLPAPGTSKALDIPASTATISRPKEVTGTHNEWRLSTTTVAPSVITKTHKQTFRKQRKPRKKALPTSPSDGMSLPKQTEQTPMTFTTTPSKVTTAVELHLPTMEKPYKSTLATPIMSPLQLSIEKAKAQFSRKKRRKAALTARQP
ncbi:uncharacterized protein proca1 [Notolabrus celidotus]|uniref:uncharacterized protein proca1 n=1 Tax=Notolabrus celidotus TaxID=1203425 RepID=UPI001490064D|nr:uncharacterized protein proca1 [Notolabrus celidotus]